ncbi:hypothetical protein ABGB17_26155 [Sphaerisporangium sp. B11E5]|uniref:hypothetical protein n=1 Tax=Sphaerisporangium sp. B11E5 TaxID=3153563 RepID=UPI00325E0225
MSIDDDTRDTIGGTTTAPYRPLRRTPRPRPGGSRPLDRDGRPGTPAEPAQDRDDRTGTPGERTAVRDGRTAASAGRAAGRDGRTATSAERAAGVEGRAGASAGRTAGRDGRTATSAERAAGLEGRAGASAGRAGSRDGRTATSGERALGRDGGRVPPQAGRALRRDGGVREDGRAVPFDLLAEPGEDDGRAVRNLRVAPGPVRGPRREGTRPPRRETGDKAPSRAPGAGRTGGRRRGAPRTPFVLLVLGLLGGGLVTLLLLNTVLARDSFLMYDLRARNKALYDQAQDRKKDLLLKSQPGVLGDRAANPTFKPDPSAPEFLDLEGGSGRPAGLDQTPLGTPPEGEATEGAPR